MSKCKTPGRRAAAAMDTLTKKKRSHINLTRKMSKTKLILQVVK
jgi:hypothetical protein